MIKRKCTKCKNEINEENIRYKRVKNKNGNRYQRVDSICKPCYNEYFRKYMKDNKQHQKLVKNNKIKCRDFVNQYKQNSNGCENCGYNKNSAALVFHHKNPKDKSFEINIGVNKSYSKQRLLTEIDKCQLLCTNCHMEIEYPHLNI